MKLFKWNKVASAASLFILSLSLVACQNQEVAQMPVQPEPTPAPVQEEHVEESNTSLYTAPLTGLPVDEAITRRPLAVMINNAPAGSAPIGSKFSRYHS